MFTLLFKIRQYRGSQTHINWYAVLFILNSWLDEVCGMPKCILSGNNVSKLYFLNKA